jgi:hypothetical protein
MYVKFLNTTTGHPFVVSSKSVEHYKDSKNIVYLGKCDDKGTITLSAEEDEEYKARTLAEHQRLVELNLKKKAAQTAQRHESDETTDIDDEA